MCDYSLYTLQNRLACEGEDWAAHRLASGWVGFASAVDTMHSDRESPEGEKDALIRGSEGISSAHREQCRA